MIRGPLNEDKIRGVYVVIHIKRETDKPSASGHRDPRVTPTPTNRAIRTPSPPAVQISTTKRTSFVLFRKNKSITPQTPTRNKTKIRRKKGTGAAGKKIQSKRTKPKSIYRINRIIF
jgi:hypothetical protein